VNGTQHVAATIVDDDGPTVALSLAGSSPGEVDGTTSVIVTLSDVSPQDVNITLVLTRTSPRPGEDPRSFTTITIPAGQRTGSITLTAVQGAPDETIVVDILGVTNAAVNGSQPTTVTIAPADVLGPVIRSLRTLSSGRRGRQRITGIVLEFNESLDPSRVQNLLNYTLLASGPDRRFGNRNDRAVALRQATYDPNARTVTLVPTRPLATNQAYRLTVNGMSQAVSVSDRAGNLLDGDSNGTRGGDFLGRFGRPERPAARARR
ncbi:MAG TPA: Ig-like domain-containing protein, partial [Isosphaeraceae bacterium]|jgi:hypothetical protein